MARIGTDYQGSDNGYPGDLFRFLGVILEQMMDFLLSFSLLCGGDLGQI
jgi:hypothetical protein